MKPYLFVLSALLSLSLPASSWAQLSLPHFFSDHMVLQRERAASIWGKAEPDAAVNVSFKGKTATAKADAEGQWRLAIETGAADAQGAELKVASGDKSIAVSDVLVGEVWLASGQSNMYFTMNRVPAYEELMSKANYPGLRMFNAPLVTAAEPQDDIEGEWSLCSPETVPGYSAVAFFYALKLHQELGIPVGVLKTCWGGKPVETFTSREALNTLPGTKALVDKLMTEAATYNQASADAEYAKRLEQWKATMAAAKDKPAEARKRLPKKPAAPKPPLITEGKPGVLFNAMINPFAGYTMRGAIWYQGEGNAKAGAVPYDQTLPLMIKDWRQRWNDEFSFYFVQLANYRTPSTAPGTQDYWALLQDRMRLILQTTPKTGMAVINDVGEVSDIHPKDKMTPGYRLARWALAKDYGRDLIYSSPLYKSSEVKDSAMHITFDHAGTGLKARDGGDLKRFEIAGADRVWHWATAKIEGADRVVVSSPEVKEPAAVRYAWASNPEGANLVNSEDLPASVFRTDDWDDVEPKEGPVSATGVQARRAKALEIKTLNDQLSKLDKGSDEFKALRKKIQGMLAELKTLAPKK
ncbi:sialate O-acetylesterase [Prosthecobacter fusiformis]|uniref:Sialate O-acetylesterase n=1 Tax=Prosthecobacter fusiformis TaxID=48464 RepID=A0A4R7RLJ1_9BACT|nr:sialate O-acetylesterase [Prosthecobacter fusiformis]TDU66184.1 sialate O-acetylesterase [Prosthecobacter fusiformis]